MVQLVVLPDREPAIADEVRELELLFFCPNSDTTVGGDLREFLSIVIILHLFF